MSKKISKKLKRPKQQPGKHDLVHSLNRDLIPGFLLLLVTLLAYQPVWNGQPIWDDDGHITKPELQSLDGLKRIWIELGVTQQYYPLVHTVFWLEHRLWGDLPLGYHLLNILLHVLSALFLVKILRYLNVPGALLAGAIFALHPVQVESVAWITELKNTLSGVFFLSSAIAYLKFDRERIKMFYAMAMGLFILGLMSKSAIATLPVSLLAVFWWSRGRLDWKHDVLPLIPLLVVGIMSGLFTAWVERKFIGAEGSAFTFTFIERGLIAGRVVWFYLSKIVCPIDLIFIYPRWNVSQAIWWQYLFPTATLLLTGLLWKLRNRWRAPLALFVCFIATIFPVMGFFNVYPFRFSFVADHFLYLACIGPIVFVAAELRLAIGLLKEKGRVFFQEMVYGILLLSLFLLTWRQSGMYENAETLYRTTIRKNPGCWMAFNNLGTLLMEREQNEEAIAYYRKSLELNPDNYKAYASLGKLSAKLGRTDDALAYYQKALEINPHLAEVYNNLGNLLVRIGRTEDAFKSYQKSLEINPRYAEAHNNIGNLLTDLRQIDEAMAHYSKAIELNPNYVDAHYNLGNLLENTGMLKEAIIHFRWVLEIKPGFAEAHNNLANALFQTGQIDEAITQYRRVLEINPNKINTLKNLSYAFTQKGQLEDAIPPLQRALALAKSSGDDVRAKEISENLERLKEESRSTIKMPR
jgi:protein O-mannosyl-transferase